MRGVVLLLALLLLGPAATATASETPRRGGTLVFAVDSELGNYDCHANISFAFLHPVAPHYSTLLKFDLANYPQVVGDLAESWTVAPDKRSYIFKLRSGVRFHDGSPLTAVDVKASYERIARPPQGVTSPRQVDYAAIERIDTPDPLTVIFRLKWPEAAMLANFASPWNCIYSAAKLAADPLFPRTNVMGSGPFTFVEHAKKEGWKGKRFDRYFLAGKPYLDGYEAKFMTGAKVVDGLKSGTIMGQFRSFTPTERDQLVQAMGEKATVGESPWLINLLLVFNTKRPPFDDARVRRALSLAIDRWQMADSMANTSFLKFVGGLMRPGSSMATPESELMRIPGFARDIDAARTEARKLLAEAGHANLQLLLTNRDIPMPYGPAAEAMIAAWREIGVTATQEKLNTRDWQAALEGGKFAVGVDFTGDYFDDPTLQLAKYVSRELSPSNFAASSDQLLDALFVGQALTVDPRTRARIVRDFEQRALGEAYTVPILWWNRIVVTNARVRGWQMSPSHYIGQDLTEVWLAR
jgi:peptide/nickel transport system substrate-binding protein